MSLIEMLDKDLPLNRKERFYTGTVFPMLVCKDNFRHLNLFLSLIGISPVPEIISDTEVANILFFTEYSLVESLIRGDRQRFIGLPSSKDTPDIMFLIKVSTTTLVALEAKMYDVPSREELDLQMRAQQAHLESIENTLGLDAVYHYALLPEKLKQQVQTLGYPILTWESILKQYEPVCRGDYFYNLLDIALSRYDDLVSPWSGFGQYADDKLAGQTLVQKFKLRTLQMLSMGREGGITGDKIKGDIDTGKWRTNLYETSSKPPLKLNRNWFAIEDFVRLVESQSSGDSKSSMHSEIRPKPRHC